MRGTLTLISVAVLAGAIGFWLGRDGGADSSNPGDPSSTGRMVKFYQSPMHPWIVSETPGRCTICGMELVPVYEGEAGFGMGETVQLNDSTSSVVGVRTAEAQMQDLNRTLRVNGVFEVDHTRHRVMSARVPGRIEQLYVDQVGIEVKADEPLATLYSPEMLSAQRVYLERLVAGPGAVSSSQLAEARERLLDLGATEEDITRLEETREPIATVTVRAPFAGTVIRRGDRAFAGAYVEEADTLFELGDLNRMWFVFDAYEADLSVIERGQTVTIFPSLPAEDPVYAPISFIDPNLDRMKRTAGVRVVVPNPVGRWHHQQTARAEVNVRLGNHLTVPRSAVLFTRRDPIVFEQVDRQTYRPRSVVLGAVGDEGYAIRSGLAEGARVVTEAALLLEGQAQLNSPVNLMEEPEMADMSDAFTDIAALEPLVLAAADAAAALANDDLRAFAAELPELQARWTEYRTQTPDAVDGPLDEMVSKLVAGPNITAAREPFEPFSTAVADLARQAGLHRMGKINIFQCPMTPVLGTGRWVQRDADLRNPFFGASMLTCGSPVN